MGWIIFRFLNNWRYYWNKKQSFEQLAEIQRSFPIWCMEDWMPIAAQYQKSFSFSYLGKLIAHYNMQGQQIGSYKKLTYLVPKGQFLLVSETNDKCTLSLHKRRWLFIDVVTKNYCIWGNKLKPNIKEADQMTKILSGDSINHSYLSQKITVQVLWFKDQITIMLKFLWIKNLNYSQMYF